VKKLGAVDQSLIGFVRNQTKPMKNRPRLRRLAAHVTFKREQAKERQRASGGDKKSKGAKSVCEKSNRPIDKPPAPPKARRAVQEAAATQGISEFTLRQGGDRKSSEARNRLREKSNEVDSRPPAPPKARRAVQEAAATQGISESTRQGSTR
jgi:hypothetical protein